MKKRIYGNGLLFITALIWGTSFVAQYVGVTDDIGPHTFNFARNFVAALFLVVFVIPFLSHSRKKKGEVEEVKGDSKTLILGGICCGLALFLAMTFQQIGIVQSTAGKAGFITALYIIIVPLFGLFLGKKVSPKIWLCVFLAALGMYLLSFKGGFQIGKGDQLLLVCAAFFAIHILVIDHFSPKVDGVRMSCIQFLVAGVCSLITALFTETISLPGLLEGVFPILYVGIMSSGVGYTLQIVAQRNTDPTVASLILSLESVFAVISGVIFLGQMMTARELMGCAVMMVAIVLAQMPDKKERERA